MFVVNWINEKTMEKKFKTNIKCTGCVEKVTPVLNELPGVESWNVDLTSPQRTLTVEGGANASEIKESLKKVGYTAEEV